MVLPQNRILSCRRVDYAVVGFIVQSAWMVQGQSEFDPCVSICHMHSSKWLACMTPSLADRGGRACQEQSEPGLEGLFEHWNNAALSQVHREAVPDFTQVPSVSAADISPDEFHSSYVVRLPPSPPPPPPGPSIQRRLCSFVASASR